jgi:hypothetical protein
MRVRIIALLPVLLLVCVSAAQAQYIEIYKLDNAAKETTEAQALQTLASHLGIPADTLKAQKAEYKLSIGELYFAHQLAKVGKSDFKKVIAEAKSPKAWGVIAKEMKVDVGDMDKDVRQLESSLKKSSRAGN